MTAAPLVISQMIQQSRPTASVMMHQSFAFFDACIAPARSPCENLEFTCAAKMIATMPRGKQLQQRIVRTIACHR